MILVALALISKKKINSFVNINYFHMLLIHELKANKKFAGGIKKCQFKLDLVTDDLLWVMRLSS